MPGGQAVLALFVLRTLRVNVCEVQGTEIVIEGRAKECNPVPHAVV